MKKILILLLMSVLISCEEKFYTIEFTFINGHKYVDETQGVPRRGDHSEITLYYRKDGSHIVKYHILYWKIIGCKTYKDGKLVNHWKKSKTTGK